MLVLARVPGVGATAGLEPPADALALSLPFALALLCFSAFAAAFGLSTLHAVRMLHDACLVAAMACQPVWADGCSRCGRVVCVCVEHRPRLVVAVLELLLVDQVLIDVVYEGLVTSTVVVSCFALAWAS